MLWECGFFVSELDHKNWQFKAPECRANAYRSFKLVCAVSLLVYHNFLLGKNWNFQFLIIMEVIRFHQLNWTED